ncbi:hypothetical protein CBL_11276 [Carabus blaptoides fortunei]
MIPTLFDVVIYTLTSALLYRRENSENPSATIMSINLRIVVLWATIVLCISQSSAFFLSWGRAEPPPAEPQSQWPVPFIYQQRLLQSPPPYQNNEQSVSLPAIPIQVPLQAQLAPAPNIHNVQLVPCLCPVTQEELDKAPDNIYNMKNKV